MRDGRGSILWRVEGVQERPWHAHTPHQAGMDLRTRTPYANLFSGRSVNDSVDILLFELHYIIINMQSNYKRILFKKRKREGEKERDK